MGMRLLLVLLCGCAHPPPAVEPYVIVKVLPPASVSDDTVIVRAETVSVPALDVE